MPVNIFDLTSHELDVIRTFGSVLGAIGGFCGGIGAIAAFLARYWAKKAANNTATTDWKSGVLVETPVAETARHIRHDTEQVADWARGNGRYRLPTEDIPRQDTE